MTDARLRSEWLGSLEFDALSDTAWRVLTGALMWSAKQGTDGLIPMRYLKSLHPDGEQPDAFAEIVKIGRWSLTPNGYLLTDWAGALGQSTAEEVRAYKENARVRSQRHREKQRKLLTEKTARANGVAFTDDSVTRDVTREVRPHVGTGTGTGEGTDNEDLDEAKSSTVQWPVVEIGKGVKAS